MVSGTASPANAVSSRRRVETTPEWVPPLVRKLYFAAERIMTSARADAGHQWDHVLRVTRTALHVAAEESADPVVVAAAGLLHDLGRTVPGEGNHAARSVRLATPLLCETALTARQVETVLEAIADHRYRAGRVPPSLEGRILQDADRLDAMGALGVARCLGRSGALGRRLYHPTDPFHETARPLDDRQFAVDHFYAKLLKLPPTLHTETARNLAGRRHAFLLTFLSELREELTGAS